MTETTLKLEVRAQEDQTPSVNVGGTTLMLWPPINENYWTYRVRLSDTQAIVGFPKFGTIGIGFALEGDSWNTNLPYRCGADGIFRHIRHNKGDDSISDDDCLAAIRMIQEAATAWPRP